MKTPLGSIVETFALYDGNAGKPSSLSGSIAEAKADGAIWAGSQEAIELRLATPEVNAPVGRNGMCTGLTVYRKNDPTHFLILPPKLALSHVKPLVAAGIKGRMYCPEAYVVDELWQKSTPHPEKAIVQTLPLKVGQEGWKSECFSLGLANFQIYQYICGGSVQAQKYGERLSDETHSSMRTFALSASEINELTPEGKEGVMLGLWLGYFSDRCLIADYKKVARIGRILGVKRRVLPATKAQMLEKIARSTH